MIHIFFSFKELLNAKDNSVPISYILKTDWRFTSITFVQFTLLDYMNLCLWFWTQTLKQLVKSQSAYTTISFLRKKNGEISEVFSENWLTHENVSETLMDTHWLKTIEEPQKRKVFLRIESKKPEWRRICWNLGTIWKILFQKLVNI